MLDTSNGSRGTGAAWGLLVAVLACTAFIAYMRLAPTALPDTAPPEAYSAARAFVHVEATSQVPHPAGTAENRAVRDYLLETLADMGVDANMHRPVHDWGRGRNYGSIGIVENVLARIPGTGGGKAFALMAHYDSVPYGPGAADDMAGVATMLEVARALKHSPPLKNDVVLVFTDAEEGGLRGAKAFREHPWADEIAVMLNMEARGTKGPSGMFETSAENGWLIAQLAQAGVPVRATSLGYDVYKSLPFNTDFTPLKEHIAGFNIAFVDNFVYYHTINDSPENLSLNSLQHHGEYALGLARHFGNISLSETSAPDAAYFDLLGLTLVHYPLSWNPVLTLLAIGAWIMAVALGFLKKRLSVKGFALGALAFLLGALAVSLVSGLLLGIAWVLRDGYPRILYDQNLYGAAMGLAAVATFLAVVCRAFRFVRWEDRFMGGLVWWAVLCIVLHVQYPGGAFLPQWTLLFAALGCVAIFLAAPEGTQGLPRAAILALLFGLPGFVFLVPTLLGLFSTLTLLFSPAVVLLLAFFLAIILPVWDYLIDTWRGRTFATLSTAALVLYFTALAVNGPSPARPDWNCLSYGLDLDTRQAYWISSDPEPTEWTAQFFPPSPSRETIEEFIPRDDTRYMKAPAPVADMEGPEIELVRHEEDDASRTLTLFIRSPDGAPMVYLYSEDVVLSGSILGIDIEGSEDGWGRTIASMPPEGAEVVLRVPQDAPFSLRIIEQSYGLPPVEGLEPRPAHIICEPNSTLDHRRPLRSDHIFVARTLEFPKEE